MSIRLLLKVGLVTILLASCTGIRPREDDREIVITRSSLKSSLITIRSVEPHLDELDAEFSAFPHLSQLDRSYFNAEEIDAMEGLLFRFLAIQTTLWDIVDSYGGLETKFADDETDAKAQVLSIAATLLMASHTAFVVKHFAREPPAIELMNEAYFRSEIPFGTYDRMRENVTAPDLIKAVEHAKGFYAGELADPQSALATLARTNSVYGELIRQIPVLHDEAELRLQQVEIYFPSHSQAVTLTKKDAHSQHQVLYAIQSFIFKEVSRLKTPTAHIAVFTETQKQQIFSLLEPGDLVLTYTAGYMSDVFIPGMFKHGITFIGSPEDRQGMGLSAEVLTADEGLEPKQLSANLQQGLLPDGTSANMIEAVAEGVIFNDLEHIMDTHINRMLVLRPRLSDTERAAFLVGVYSYLGDGYDFRFDFADATRQVCTEVIYRAINGMGSIDFELTMRAGHVTLSADDIANYHLGYH